MLDVCFVSSIGGHRTRDRILQKEFERQGHTTQLLTRGAMLPKSRLYIVDVPKKHLRNILPYLETSVVVMGTHAAVDLIWHPLGPRTGATHMLTGKRYLIMDPRHVTFKRIKKEYDLFIACGTLDVYNTLPKIMDKLKLPKSLRVCVVDPFNRSFDNCDVLSDLPNHIFLDKLAASSRAILGWGQSCFEAYMLDVPTLAIPQTTDHLFEANKLRVSYALIHNLPETLDLINFDTCEIPLTGAKETYLKIKERLL